MLYSIGTVTLVSSHAFEWTLANFRNNSAGYSGDILQSNPFLLPVFGSTCILKLYFSSNSIYAEVSVQNLPASYLGKIKVYIINNDNKKLYTSHTDKSKNFTIQQLIRTDLLLLSGGILAEGKLRIMFKMDENQPNISKDAFKFRALDQFEALLNNQELGDIKFVVDGEAIYANKAILVSRSSVFLDMLKPRIKEAIVEAIEITDTKYEVFLETLRFIYAGKINEIEKYWKDLLATADKFGLEELKEMCTVHICKSISVDNAMDYLSLADSHRVQLLRKNAINFIIKNGKAMAKRPDFDSLAHLHKDILLEIVRTALLQEQK